MIRAVETSIAVGTVLSWARCAAFTRTPPPPRLQTCLPRRTYCAGFGVEFSGKAGDMVPCHLEPDDEMCHLSTGSHGLGVMETLGCMSPHAVWVR